MNVCSDAGSDATPDSEAVLVFEVGPDREGDRLDTALAALSGASRSQVQRWIDSDRVLLNGEPVRRASRLSEGDLLEATPPPPEVSEVLAEAIPLDILYEDEDVIVIDKRAGMVVHPAPGHARGTLVNALLHHCRADGGLAAPAAPVAVGGVERPGIVHRLDKGTSGVMVVARNDAAHRFLAEQFHDHSIERVYRCWVRALPRASSGRVDRPIGRHPSDRKRMSVRTRSGRRAVTGWTMIERYPHSGVSELEIRPETGRTHQIRVHCASAGMPLVGDPVYGRARTRAALGLNAGLGLERPALHAASLGFVHPRSRERVRFEVPLPHDLTQLVDALRHAESDDA